MNTEITDKEKFNGWIFYDGACALCLRLVRWFQPGLRRRGFVLLPLQTPGTGLRSGLSDAALLAEMRLQKPDGKILGGADALLEISRHYRFGRLFFYPLAQVPIATRLLRRIYGWVERHRRWAGGVCETKPQKPLPEARRIVFLEMP